MAQKEDISKKEITWSVTSVTDNLTGETTSNNSTVISTPEWIQWKQSGYDLAFTIDRRTWDWSRRNGEITHRVSFGNHSGVIEIINSRGTKSINIRMKGGPINMDHTLHVKSMTY